MLFKGSKGNWKKVFLPDGTRAIRNEGGIIIRFWKPSKYPNQDERYDSELKETQANQNLVLYAPQLLDLLNQYVAASDDFNVPDHLMETFANLYANSFNLIQEATQL